MLLNVSNDGSQSNVNPVVVPLKYSPVALSIISNVCNKLVCSWASCNV